jgi:hypothetical protein
MDMPPYSEDTYIKMSAKELIIALDKKIDRLDEKVDGLVIAHAALPAVYVTQEAINDNRREANLAKRWAVTATIASVGAFGSFLTLLLA